MSMYNLIHGVNPLAGALLAALDLSPDRCGRFRDCFLARGDDDETKLLEIHVYTRNGGGNRQDYEDVTEALRAHALFLGDADDDFDCTYATYRFRVPESLRPMLDALVAKHPDSVPASPQDRFQAFMEKLQSGKDDADVARVLEVMKPMFEKLSEATKPT